MRTFVSLLVVAELVGLFQAMLRVPLRHEFVKRSLSEGRQKRDVGGAADTFHGLWGQYPLHESANMEEKKPAVQPLKVINSSPLVVNNKRMSL